MGISDQADHCGSIDRLSKRLKGGEDIITFDKDDDDTLDFVTAASNLRSAAYNIPQKNRWDVKGTVQVLSISICRPPISQIYLQKWRATSSQRSPPQMQS